MKPKNGEQVYKLIHSQEMVQYMWKYSVHRQSTQIPLAIAFDEELDFKLATIIEPAADMGRLEQVFVLTSYTTSVVGGSNSTGGSEALAPVLPTDPAENENVLPTGGVMVGVG